MGFSSHKGKTLLFSDLFKTHNNMGAQKEEEKEENITNISKMEGSICSTSSNPSSSCDIESSSSLFSDVGSWESEINGDFSVEEEEDGDDNDDENNTVLNHGDYKDYGGIKNTKSELAWSPVGVDCRLSQLQVYELKNQPSLSKQSPVKRGRRVRGTESAQQHYYMQNRGVERGILHSGSGMQAVFLCGSGSKSRSPGTGVFLPCVTKDQAELKKRQGSCTMALIPTRVLQALDLHFNRLQDSPTPPLCGASPYHSSPQDELIESDRLEMEKLPEEDDVERQLPQEWTY